MNTYNNDNYMEVYDNCYTTAVQFGAAAVNMIDVFSGPPDFELYSPEADETLAVSQFYNLTAELGG